MPLLLIAEGMFQLPLSNPVLIFSLVLFIILFVPLLLNKLKIPYVIGLIIAGVFIGEHGFNLLKRDSSIVLFGTVGLLYIMFLAALEIDLKEFKKSSSKSLIFGLLTFAVPMIMMCFAGRYLLYYSWTTSILFASMLSSHTLIAYPIAARFSVHKSRAATIAVGGTIITDILSLMVLALIARMSQGAINQAFWFQLSVSTALFAAIVWFLFPIIARWYFKRFDDNISQYIFVLAMVFLGAFLAELAGIEPIIGAFIAGLALNRLIPQNSPLMNRIDFVGNALFIPFFLIGVGMLVDIKVLFKSSESIKVAIVMTIGAIVSKWVAAWIAQKSFKMNGKERTLIFGLSSAQAAATLATVLVGYNIIIGQNNEGEPIRLLNEDVLNGSIIMILITCTIASLFTARAAAQLAEDEKKGTTQEEEDSRNILIAASKEETIDAMVELALLMHIKKEDNNIYILSVIGTDKKDREAEERRLKKYQEKMIETAAATDVIVTPLIRYDVSYVSGIQHTIEERKIQEVIIGQENDDITSSSATGQKSISLLNSCPQIIYLLHAVQPLNTIRKMRIVCPDKLEHEPSFPVLLKRIKTIILQLNCNVQYYGTPNTLRAIRHSNAKEDGADYKEFEDWNDFLILSREVKNEDLFVVISSRPGNVSYVSDVAKIPHYLSKYFDSYNYLLVYPDLNNNFNSGQAQDFERTSDFLQHGLSQIGKTGDTFLKNILPK